VLRLEARRQLDRRQLVALLFDRLDDLRSLLK